MGIERCLGRRTAAEHPAILGEQRADFAGARDEAGPKAVAGEQEGDDRGTQVGGVAEGIGFGGQQRLADQPPFGARHLLLEQRQRPVGGSHCRHRRLGPLDEPGIEQRRIDLAPEASGVGEQRPGVDQQAIAHALRLRPRQGAGVEIGLQPLRDISVVTRRAGSIAEHHVNLQRFVGRDGFVIGIAQRGFGIEDEARQQIALQGIGIGTVAFAVEPLAIQAEPRWRWRRAGGAIGQLRCQPVEQRHDFIETCGGDDAVAGVGALDVGGQGRGGLGRGILAAAIVDEAPRQCPKPEHGKNTDDGNRGNARQPVAFAPRRIGAGQPGFGKDHVLEQSVDEKGPRRLRLRSRRPPQAVRQVADQPVERRALLNAAGQVKAAQPHVGRRIAPAGSGRRTCAAKDAVDQPDAA